MQQNGITEFMGKEIELLQNQLGHLIVTKDIEEKQEFNSRFLSENIKDLRMVNEVVSEKIGAFENNNALLTQANKNLIQQLVRYQRLSERLQAEINVTQDRIEANRRTSNMLESQLICEEEAVRQAKYKQTILTEELRLQTSHKNLHDAEALATRSEIRHLEQKLADISTLANATANKQAQVQESKTQISSELFRTESKLSELRTQSEFLKREVEELGQSTAQKELRNSNLVKQKQHLQTLAEDFNKLRIGYSEKLNERVFAKNLIVKKIMADNGRLDALNEDAERTLKNLKSFL
jgi:chromosome segregation ATPase